MPKTSPLILSIAIITIIGTNTILNIVSLFGKFIRSPPLLSILLYIFFIITSIVINKKNPHLSRHQIEILRTCSYTGGCSPKYSWASYYLKKCKHARHIQSSSSLSLFVGSKISFRTHYAGKIINLFCILILSYKIEVINAT